MAERKRPHCSKCDRDHYNFVPCQAVDSFEAEQADKQRVQANLAQPILRPRKNDWGNRYSKGDFSQLGATNVSVLKRPPLHSFTRPERPASPGSLATDVASDLLGG